MEEETDSDFDWLDTQNKLTNIDGKHGKESMISIQIHYIYIDASANIEKIVSEKKDLTLLDDESIIPQNEMIKIIQTKKDYSKKKYKLLDILLYNIEVEPDKIQNYSQNLSENTPQKYLRSLSILNEIKIPPTLFIFHQTNCIYFLYQEIAPNSTLKTKTKKVLFKLQKFPISKTQKYRNVL